MGGGSDDEMCGFVGDLGERMCEGGVWYVGSWMVVVAEMAVVLEIMVVVEVDGGRK